MQIQISDIISSLSLYNIILYRQNMNVRYFVLNKRLKIVHIFKSICITYVYVNSYTVILSNIKTISFRNKTYRTEIMYFSMCI